MKIDNYETIIIMDDTLTEQQFSDKINKYKETISDFSDETTVDKIEVIGKKKLSYDIKGHKNGYYVIFYYKTQYESIPKLERAFRKDDDVLKFLSLKINEDEAGMIYHGESEQDLPAIDAYDVLMGKAHYERSDTNAKT